MPNVAFFPAQEIEQTLAEAYSETACRCEAGCGTNYTGTTIAVGLLKRMRLPDMMGT